MIGFFLGQITKTCLAETIVYSLVVIQISIEAITAVSMLYCCYEMHNFECSFLFLNLSRT